MPTSTTNLDDKLGGNEMMRLVQLALLALFLVLVPAVNPAQAAEKCEPGAVATKYPGLAGTTVKVAQDGESPPFSMRDPNDFNKLIGIDADLVRAAFKCIGVSIEFFIGAWSGLLPAVIAGQADLIWAVIYYTPARAKQVDFVTYMAIATGGLVQKGNPKNIRSLDDVCGLMATAGLGTGEEAIFRDTSAKCVASGKAPIEIVTYPNQAAGIRMIENQRADLLMTNLNTVDLLAAESPTVFERAFMLLTDRKLAVGINKNNNELRQAVYDALRILQSNGTEQAILKKYGVDPALIVPTEILTK